MSIIVKAKYKKGFFARKINADTFMKSLGEICKKNQYDARLMRTGENEYRMQLVPTGLVQFHITETILTAEAITSNAGPGFHAAVIQILNEASSMMGFVFDYDEPTDYVYNKAFAHLQKQHVADLKQTVQEIVERHKNEEVATTEYIGWEAPYMPVGQKEIITLMGSYSIEELESYVNNDFEEFAKKYFLWYNEGKDALYRKQMAMFALWNVYKWRKPMTREEANIVSSIARNLEMARMLDNDIPLPSKAWQQICAFNGIPYLNLNEFADEDIPNLGYLHGNVSQVLPLNYHLPISGSFDRFNQENAVILRDGSRQVAIQVVPEMQPGHITDPRTMLERVDIQEEINGYLYTGMWIEQANANGEKVYVLNGFVQGFSSFVNAAFSFVNEEDRDWALETFKSFETPAAQPLTFEMLDKH